MKHISDGAAGASPMSIDVDAVRQASADERLRAIREALVRHTVETFSRAGELLHAGGHILGPDRRAGQSPFGHGSDETVAVSLLLRIGGELVSAADTLFRDGRHYAAAALLRQLVEVEYLAWAFETKDQEAQRWLRSTKEERQQFFTPAKLRAASEGRFRGKDYGYHCELGGHPVPESHILLRGDAAMAQFLLSDLLGHAGRIWDHVAAWSRTTMYADEMYKLNEAMVEKYVAWKAADSLTALPPPP